MHAFHGLTNKRKIYHNHSLLKNHHSRQHHHPLSSFTKKHFFLLRKHNVVACIRVTFAIVRYIMVNYIFAGKNANSKTTHYTLTFKIRCLHLNYVNVYISWSLLNDHTHIPYFCKILKDLEKSIDFTIPYVSTSMLAWIPALQVSSSFSLSASCASSYHDDRKVDSLSFSRTNKRKTLIWLVHLLFSESL